MNIDLLKDNPKFTAYIYVAVPTFVLVILSVFIVKYLRRTGYLTNTHIYFTRPRLRRSQDEESANNHIIKDSIILACQDGSISTMMHISERYPELRRIVNHYLKVGRFNLALQRRTGSTCQADNSSLCRAVEEGRANATRLLLGAGANINGAVPPGTEGTPLKVAVHSDDLEKTKRMLDAGADVNHTGRKDGRTPLMIAAEWNSNPDIAKVLIDAGANIDASNGHRRSALMLAVERGHLDIAKLLVESGARMAPVTRWAPSPLMIAAEKGHAGIVKLLVDSGAGLDGNLRFGYSPLSVAAFNKRASIVRMLLEAGANTERFDAEIDYYTEEIREIRRQHAAAQKGKSKADSEIEQTAEGPSNIKQPSSS